MKKILFILLLLPSLAFSMDSMLDCSMCGYQASCSQTIGWCNCAQRYAKKPEPQKPQKTDYQIDYEKYIAQGKSEEDAWLHALADCLALDEDQSDEDECPEYDAGLDPLD